jgi:hypothetical protein
MVEPESCPPRSAAWWTCMFSLAAERRVCGQFGSRPTVAQPSGLDRRALAADERTRRHQAQFQGVGAGAAIQEGVGSDRLVG